MDPIDASDLQQCLSFPSPKLHLLKLVCKSGHSTQVAPLLLSHDWVLETDHQNMILVVGLVQVGVRSHLWSLSINIPNFEPGPHMD